MHEPAVEIFGKSLNDTHFACKPSIADLRRKRCGSNEQIPNAIRHTGDDAQQSRAGPRFTQHTWIYAGGGKRILRNVDAVEVAIILGAVLQVIDDLKRRAKG